MMKKQMLAVIACLAAGTLIFSCSKNDRQQDASPSVPDEIMAQIKAHGFSTDNVLKTADGYIVEGDILLTADQLKTPVGSPVLRVGQVEQYRTSNLVTGLPRVITVKVTGLSLRYVVATDTALLRYNRLGLRIQFQRVTTGNAAVTIEGFDQAPINGEVRYAYSGFPSSSGNPCPVIKLNTNAAALGFNPNILWAASTIQHELGHCIGMVHTDYMNRAFSCGGAPIRENVNAIWIPGTPMGPDPNSWMLACSNGGDRNFNGNDSLALKYLYGR